MAQTLAKEYRCCFYVSDSQQLPRNMDEKRLPGEDESGIQRIQQSLLYVFDIDQCMTSFIQASSRIRAIRIRITRFVRLGELSSAHFWRGGSRKLAVDIGGIRWTHGIDRLKHAPPPPRRVERTVTTMETGVNVVGEVPDMADDNA